MVRIHNLKHSPNFIIGKGSVKSLHYFFELNDSQLSVFVSVIGIVGLIEIQIFCSQYFVQFEETSLHFLLQIGRYHNLPTLFAPPIFIILLITLFVKIYSMFFHLSGQLFHRDGSICIGIHLFEEKFDLLFQYFGMNMSNELSEFFVVELCMVFKA